ncbi:uncharacterized protein LOC114360967 [Ostrinia furnacalis]|uniref:uncharacterized protein LOC114360967 n=1 Tax=Ostrinia furnacalis TaxID=93504 RepID=UPI001038880F|nr:uncharacterized protein LOC114360967 [Ostrinia furnacalis]
MPECCAVPMCSNRIGGHKFPADADRTKQWVEAIRRPDFTPSKHSVVCKRHFTDDDFVMPQDSVLQRPRPQLKKTAVPSIFPWNKPGNPWGRPKGSVRKKFTVPAPMNDEKEKGDVEILTSESQICDASTINDNKNKVNPVRKNLKVLKVQKIGSLPTKLKRNISKINKDNLNLILNKKLKYLTSNTNEQPITININNNINTILNNLKEIKIKKSTPAAKPKRNLPSNNVDLIICEKVRKYLDSNTNVSPETDLCSSNQNFTNSNTSYIVPIPSAICEVSYTDDHQNEDSRKTTHNNIQFQTDAMVQCNLCQCSTIEKQKRIFSIDNLMDTTNPAEVKYYTGFADYQQFTDTFKLLGDGVYDVNKFHNTKKSLTLLDQFLLTVIKLRRNKPLIELGFNFCIKKETVAIVLKNWIEFLFCKLKDPSMLCHTNYGSERPCIIIIESHGNEPENVPSESPESPKVHSSISVKVCVGITDNSIHVSEAYPGNLGDDEVKLRARSECNELKELASDSNVKCVTVVLSKTYTILSKKMDPMLLPLTNKIVFVCFMLSNFNKEARKYY